MDFTGEQVVLGETGSRRTENDHLSRYKFTIDFVVGKTVLDIACGTGYGVKMLKDAGAKKVYGVDSSSEAIEHARKNYGGEGVEFIKGNAAQLSFPDDFFDLIATFETIEHLDEETRDGYLKELHRVLKNDGTIFLSTPNRIWVSPFRKFKQPLYPYHVIEYNERELVDCLTRFNFKIANIYGQRIIHRVYNLSLVRRFLMFVEKKILKRRIDKYWIPTGPQVVRFGFFHEPRTYFMVFKK